MMSTIWFETCRGIWKDIINKCIRLETRNQILLKQLQGSLYRDFNKETEHNSEHSILLGCYVLSNGECYFCCGEYYCHCLAVKIGLLDPEKESNTFLQNIGNYLLIHKA